MGSMILANSQLSSEQIDFLDELNNQAYFVASRTKTALMILHATESKGQDTEIFIDFHHRINEINEKGNAISKWSLNCISLQHFPSREELSEISVMSKKLEFKAIETHALYFKLIENGHKIGPTDVMKNLVVTVQNALDKMNELILIEKVNHGSNQ